MRIQFSSGLVFIALLAAPVYATAQVEIIEPEDRSPGIVKIARGTTECREPSRDNARCATEYWTLYFHADGSRYIHVVSDNMRFGQARHAMVWVDPKGETREAYINTWTKDGVIGSAYVVKREDSVDVAASDLRFERAGEGMIREEVKALARLDSIGVGPAAADGLHFLHYDFDAAGRQPHGIYWMGGTLHGTMVGVIALSQYTYLGEEEITIADGKTFLADKFEMVSGTKVWLTKEDRILLRMDLVFGAAYGSIFETVSLDIAEVGS